MAGLQVTVRTDKRLSRIISAIEAKMERAERADAEKLTEAYERLSVLGCEWVETSLSNGCIIVSPSDDLIRFARDMGVCP